MDELLSVVQDRRLNKGADLAYEALIGGAPDQRVLVLADLYSLRARVVVEYVARLNYGRALALQLVANIQLILVREVLQLTVGLALHEGDQGLEVLLPGARVARGLLHPSHCVNLIVDSLRALGLS